jgi:hypothetical protein
LAIYINDSLSFRLSVVVTYRPKEGGDAHPALERDGVVEIYGPTNIRSLLPLRAIFCKIFPAQNSFELKPELFQKDERFAGLSLGLCRVSRGWFAISVVRNDLACNITLRPSNKHAAARVPVEPLCVVADVRS